MEQKKFSSKAAKQTIHITDKKHNIVGIPFITKFNPTIKVLKAKIHLKDKHTRMKNTSLTFFRRLIKQPSFFSNFYPIYNQERKLETISRICI